MFFLEVNFSPTNGGQYHDLGLEIGHLLWGGTESRSFPFFVFRLEKYMVMQGDNTSNIHKDLWDRISELEQTVVKLSELVEIHDKILKILTGMNK